MGKSQVASALERLHDLLKQKADWSRFHRFEQSYPDSGPLRRELYTKHLEVFEATKRYRHVAMMGGNGAGKTWLGTYLIAAHATGLYPKWWPGRIYKTPIKAWAAGKSKETVRDILQAKLVGEFAKEGESALGSGMIPRDLIVDYKTIPNTGGSLDFVAVRHVSGGVSVLGFKSYDQGRKAFEGTERHFIWLDEEPPSLVMAECGMRGRTVEGGILLTFTPLEGYTEVVNSFINYEEENKKGASKCMVRVSMDDVPHLSEAEKTELLAAAPAYQRKARRFGTPVAGAGMVYPVPEDQFVINPIPIPPHWRKVAGLDHGWYNTAVVWIAYDKDQDTAYVYSEYKAGEVDIPTHATRMKARGHWIPVVGDASAINLGNGEQVLESYRKQGIRMKLADKAVREKIKSTDAGIQAVLERLGNGKLKIFATCQKLLDETRTYSYDEDGKIKKQNDHLCLSGDTLVKTDNGSKPIRDLVGTVGQVVSIGGRTVSYGACFLSRQSAEVVRVSFSDGSEVICTPDHTFLTREGWARADQMVSKWLPSYQRQRKNFVAAATTFVASIFKGTVSAFTERFWNTFTARLSLPGSTFTTLMATNRTTIQKTWSYFQPASICHTMGGSVLGHRRPRERLNSPQSGMAAMLAVNGIKSITDNLRIAFTQALKEIAGAAENVICRLGPTAIRSVQMPASQHIGERLARTMKAGRAPVAGLFSWLTNTLERAHAVEHVQCTKVMPAGAMPVYCMSVPETACFALGNGIIAHNCDALRYVIHSGLAMATTQQVERFELEQVRFG